jgi:hypothetical protein
MGKHAQGKSAKIRQLLLQGKDVQEIVSLVNVRPNRVYMIASEFDANDLENLYVRDKLYLDGSNLIARLYKLGISNVEIAEAIQTRPEQLSRWASGRKMHVRTYKKLESLLAMVEQ